MDENERKKRLAELNQAIWQTEKDCRVSYTGWPALKSTVTSSPIDYGYDTVEEPSHYVEGREIEPISVIEDWQLGFHLGNALKYIARAGRKSEDPTEDIEKARWYLARYLESLK